MKDLFRVTLVFSLVCGQIYALELTIGNYTLVGKERVSRTDFDFTYRADVTNAGGDVQGVLATVMSQSPNTVVVDGNLNFGNVSSGTTVTSSDTFIIRQNRLHAFDWSDLVWNVQATVMVTVPDVVGMAQADAEAAITAGNLTVGAVTTTNSATVPVGNVISQNPMVGASVAQGSAVDLVVSLGPLMVTVPDVVGMIQADAQIAIAAANLTVGTVTTANSDTVPAGSVISQNPVSGTSVAEGSSVNLVVSLGPPVMVTVPNVVGLAQAEAEAAIAAANLTVGAVATAHSAIVTAGNVIGQNPAGDTTVDEGSTVHLVVSVGPWGEGDLPPDPDTVAPKLDRSVATTMFAATEFLYSGDDPTQMDVAPGAIEPKRVAVLRGKVMKRDGAPLPGVAITVLDHSEYGSTLTRADGMFDMAVNGGGFLTVDYRKDGYLPVQRQTDAPWQDYVWLPDVVMIPIDDQVTTIDLTSGDPMQVAMGSEITDDHGVRQPVTIRRGYVYEALYLEPDDSPQAFGRSSDTGVSVTVDPARQEIILWRTWQDFVGVWDSRTSSLGAWSLDVHHAYVPSERVLYLGDGSSRSSEFMKIITTVAGTGESGFSGDGGPAVDARIGIAVPVTVGPDGSIYIADYWGHRIRRVDPDGIINTVVGNGDSGFSGDGGPATNAQLNGPMDVALGPDGSISIADLQNNRVRRVDPDGIINTVAGNGTFGFSGDGGPATDAQLFSPTGIAVGPDGSIYIADSFNYRIRRVGPDGIITTVAGNGTWPKFMPLKIKLCEINELRLSEIQFWHYRFNLS